MTYFIHPAWFYLINLVSNLKGLGIILIIISAIILFLFLFSYIEGSESEQEKIKKKFKKRFLLPLTIGIIVMFFIPDKETCIEMTVASIVTKENVNYTVETVKDITDYVVEKVKDGK